ncbi:MAG: transglycosylase domain-containing protein [Gaiellaceae bacterium]
MTPPDDDFNGRRRRQRRRRRRRISRKRRATVVVGGLLALCLVVIAGAVAAGAAFGTGCDLAALRPVALGANSFVYAADGSLLGSIPAEKNSQPVPLEEMSPAVVRATIAIEDRRFYEHGGIDVAGIARAFWADVRAGKVVQGGSTITQQLVRNLYDISQERSLERKVREACLAVKVDRSWSKQRVLAGYLNNVYYGNRAYGIEAAAQTYFSKSARELDVSEAAILAGLPQAPSDFDPFKRPDKALARRNDVLRALFETGQITQAAFDEAVSRGDLGLDPGKLYTEIKEPYFFSYVRDVLIAEYGAQTVRSGGLKVYTTIDPRFQRIARKVMRDTLTERTDPAAALVAINPANGAIRAMTAITPGKKGNQYNLATQGQRQAGSTFKTFVLTAAIEQGMDPDATSYVSAPFTWNPDPELDCEENTGWCPVQTYSHSYLGSTSVTRATLASDNTVYAQLTLDVGPDRVVETASKMGVNVSALPEVPAIGLGAASITPLEMASAYATLAAGGIYSKPLAIRRIVFADGKVDESWGEPERERVLPDWVAAEVTRILEQNHDYGTGGLASSYFPSPAAGKTGTTDNIADAWYCGYTPVLSTTVWLGYPRAQIPMLNLHGFSAVAGGTLPALIWGKFMQSAFPSGIDREFPTPESAPEWEPFERGEYALSLPETTSEETETATTATKPKPTTAEPEPEPEPTTTVEPPPTTTEPPPEPPPTTTEPAAPG